MNSTNISLQPLLLIVFLLSIHFTGCTDKPGDPNKYTTLSISDITEKNVPRGLVLREGNLYPEEGFEFATSQDSTRVMLIQTGKDRGFASYRCECKSGFGLTCIRIKGIIGCSQLICAQCAPLLIVYDSPIAFDRSE